MPNRATHQLPFLTLPPEDNDLFYAVRDNGNGTYSDLSIRKLDLSPNIRTVSIVIPSADVLQLNSTTQTVLFGGVAGYFNLPLFVVTTFGSGSTSYATNTNLVFFPASLTAAEAFAEVDISANPGEVYVSPVYGSAYTQFAESEGVICQVETGNPTAGDCDLTITLYYQLITA